MHETWHHSAGPTEPFTRPDNIHLLLCMQVVGDTQAATDGGNSDLLNAFNVATFKGDDEDEANFWNRLIPTSDRVKEEAAPEPLGVRAARLRNAEEVQIAADSTETLRAAVCRMQVFFEAVLRLSLHDERTCHSVSHLYSCYKRAACNHTAASFSICHSLCCIHLLHLAQAVVRGTSPAGGDSDGSRESDQDKTPAKAGRSSRAGAPKAAGGGSSRRRSAAQEPGPPVEGALARIDTWPTDGPDGQPLPRMVGLPPKKMGHMLLVLSSMFLEACAPRSFDVEACNSSGQGLHGKGAI